MERWKKILGSLLAMGLFCGVLAGCGGGVKDSSNGKKADPPQPPEKVAALKLGDRELPVYTFTGADLPSFFEGCFAVNGEAIYGLTKKDLANDKYEWQLLRFPYEGGRIGDGKKIAVMGNDQMTTNGKEVFFWARAEKDKGDLLGIAQGEQVSLVLRKQGEAQFRSVYGTDTAYFMAKSALQRGKLDTQGFSAAKVLLSRADIARMKAERNLESPHLMAADADGFYVRWLNKHGSRQGKNWTYSLHTYDPEGKELRVLELNQPIPQASHNHLGQVFTTRQYLGILGTFNKDKKLTGCIRLYDRETGAYVTDLELSQIPDSHLIRNLMADGEDHLFFQVGFDKATKSQLYRLDF